MLLFLIAVFGSGSLFGNLLLIFGHFLVSGKDALGAAPAQLPPWSRSLRALAWASISLHGPLDVCLDVVPAAPIPSMQKGDAQHMSGGRNLLPFEGVQTVKCKP